MAHCQPTGLSRTIYKRHTSGNTRTINSRFLPGRIITKLCPHDGAIFPTGQALWVTWLLLYYPRVSLRHLRLLKIDIGDDRACSSPADIFSLIFLFLRYYGLLSVRYDPRCCLQTERELRSPARGLSQRNKTAVPLLLCWHL